MKKGITISTLVVAITIILILSSVATVVGIRSIKTASFEEFSSKLVRVSNDINLYHTKNKELPLTNEVLHASSCTEELKAELAKYGDNNSYLYVVDMNKLNTESVNIGYGTIEDGDVFVIAKDTNNIYYFRGIKYKGVVYYGIQK